MQDPKTASPAKGKDTVKSTKPVEADDDDAESGNKLESIAITHEM